MTDATELRAATEQALASLPDVEAYDGSWSRGGTVFAALNGSTIEIRLGATIAPAAIRTPDTRPSPRGADWIAFSPTELDGHALDRLGAWLEAAHRRATG